MQSETTSLTEWEAKERAGLLALETDEWREKRLIAEDRNTTAEELQKLFGVVRDTRNTIEGEKAVIERLHLSACLLTEAISAHPNAPPELLLCLLSLSEPFVRFSSRGVCHNPVGPFLCLETPDFWQRVDVEGFDSLLRDKTLPPVAVQQLTRHTNEEIAEPARFHAAFSGEIKTRQEWSSGLLDFWQKFCARQMGSKYWDVLGCNMHAEVAELGLAPVWVTGYANCANTIKPPVPQPFYWYAREWYDGENSPPSPDVKTSFLARFFPGIADMQRRDALWHQTICRYHKGSLSNLLLRFRLRPNASPRELSRAIRAMVDDSETLPVSAYSEVLFAHPNLNASHLRQLAGVVTDGSLFARIAAHPKTPSDVIKSLTDFVGVSSYASSKVRRFACWHKNTPPDNKERARNAFFRSVAGGDAPDLPLISFVAATNGHLNADKLRKDAQFSRCYAAASWVMRLNAALKLPITSEPFAADPWKRSPLDLLNHLGHDGNRFVRWAAQTRLADPDFAFTWADEE